MDREIKGLRKKFFILSGVISFTVIFIMLLVLNIAMRMSYNAELKSASAMLTQTAFANALDINSETILLKDTEKNEGGDSIILRDPTAIKILKIHGNITCENKNAEWFCGGGGVFFEMPDEKGNVNYIYKEYKFNRDNTEITLDFTDNSDFVVSGKPVKADIKDVSKEKFYISVVWWASSDLSADAMKDKSVKLELDSIDIQYRENVSVGSVENYDITQRDFGGTEPSSIPDALNSYSCFYFVTDSNDGIVEINSGSSMKSFDRSSAEEIIKSDSGVYEENDTEYTKTVTQNEDIKVYAFVSNVQAKQSSERLLYISVLSGGGMFLIVLLLVYIISGRAVRPISDSYKKQKEFISNASHELKLPITVISATADLMEKKSGPDRLTDCIYAQVKKMGRLVNEMLMLTRLSEPEKYADSFENFDLSKKLSNSLLYFESKAFEEEKEIVSEIEENISYWGLPDKISDMTDILIDNALKYSDEKGVIKVNLRTDKGKIIFTCSNPCKDFDVEDIPHLFDRFYRGDKSHSNEKEGFGLGLSIAKETVQLHNGEIKAEYDDGKVVFKVTL